ATQTVGSEQPIYNPTSKSINLVNKSFQIYFGVNAFSGIVYIADSVHGVLDFNISVGSNSTLDLDAQSSFLTNLIGVVITSNLNHKNVIENYFGSKSQNLKYSNAVDTYIISSGGTSSSLLMNITTVPLINTRQITTGGFSFLEKIRLFPYLETTTTRLYGFAYLLTLLKVFPPINTSQVSNEVYAWSYLYYLIAFPAFDSRNMNSFYYFLFRAYSISQLSLDNVLISLAAGVANNIGKSFSTNAAYPTILNEHSGNYISNINRRPPTFTETQDNIPTWNNIINEYKNGQKTETVAENELINLVDEYNIKWKTWEQALRNVDESLNGVQYNFSNGTVSGQKAYYWMVAKKNISMPQLTAPTTLTTGVTRSYRSNSGLTVSGSNVSGWTPVTGTSSQTITGLTTQTINGITC
ncbi:hypothetical protein EBU94_08235, partial [bacterium]|nr:hypothetical protein [bacterium]